MSRLISSALLLALLLIPEIAQSTETRIRTRARRCICISISCGCYRPQIGPVYRQPPTHWQPSSASTCVSSCVRSCMRIQYGACQQSCQNSCGVQMTYPQPRYTPSPYQYESPSQSVVPSGQQSSSGGGACIQICMPSCQSQCVQQTAAVPVVQQSTTPVPVVQQSSAYYPSPQHEPTSVQQYSGSGNTICIHLCMPSCESQCIERTTAMPYTGGYTESPGTYYGSTSSPTEYQTITIPYSSSYQSSIQSTQTPLIIRPQQGTTICIPICMPACQAQCTEGQESSVAGQSTSEIYSTQGPMSTQTELPPHEISINLPQSIQQSPNCPELCQETCMQQCTGQSQPAEQCRPSCSYTCQESCAQAPTTTQEQQTLMETYETTELSSQTSPVPMSTSLIFQTPLRSPSYYQQALFREPQITGCQSGSFGSGHCNCPSGYVICLSTSAAFGQQCCKRRR